MQARRECRVSGSRVLITGHEGYLGTVTVAILEAAGHDALTGLDSGFFADCVLGPAPKGPPAMQMDLRDVAPDAAEPAEPAVSVLGMTDPAAIGSLQRSADQHVESLRSWLQEAKQAAPSSCAGRRRGRWPSAAAPVSIRGCVRRSPTPRPPNGAGGCQVLTSRSCCRMNSSRLNRIGCSRASRPFAGGQRTEHIQAIVGNGPHR
jgi:hypothetical protein